MSPPSPVTIAAFAATAAAFVALAWTETRHGRAGEEMGSQRIATNFLLGVGNSLIALALPLGTGAAALLAADRGWGLLNHVRLPWIGGLLVLIMLRSLGMYVFHRASHAVPWLWRIHRVHHTDRAFDLSTAFRSHPAELLIAAPIAAGLVIAVGAPLALVVVADAVLLIVAMWEHGDLAVPAAVERSVGLLVATPRQHRLHHHPLREFHDRNFGDTLILWDRLFGTYREPLDERPPVGLPVGSGERLSDQLLVPFRP